MLLAGERSAPPGADRVLWEWLGAAKRAGRSLE